MNYRKAAQYFLRVNRDKTLYGYRTDEYLYFTDGMLFIRVPFDRTTVEYTHKPDVGAFIPLAYEKIGVHFQIVKGIGLKQECTNADLLKGWEDGVSKETVDVVMPTSYLYERWYETHRLFRGRKGAIWVGKRFLDPLGAKAGQLDCYGYEQCAGTVFRILEEKHPAGGHPGYYEPVAFCVHSEVTVPYPEEYA